MAKLRIEAPDKKILVVDVEDADQSEYDALATAAVEDYMSHQVQARVPSEEEKISAKDIGGVLWDTVKDAGTLTKAGYAGVADIIAGNGLKKASENVSNVKEGKDVTSGAAVIGEGLGSQFTPVQIALQAVGGKVAQALGPLASRLMSGWSEAAARAAIGWTKKIAEAIGIEDFAAVGRFLLEPIVIGGKTLKPIVTATSSAEEMLAAAKLIKSAAGKDLEKIALVGDKAIAETGEEGGISFMADLPALKQKLIDLRNVISDYAPNMGKAATNQYDAAIADIDMLLDSVTKGNTSRVFSTLSKIKTTIGDLTFRHGSPLESKAAYNDVYHAVSDTLSKTAKNVGGATSQEYATANAVYNKAATIVEALEGKVLGGSSARSFFNDPAALVAGITTGASVNPIVAPFAFLATKAAENYGPQAIASGLNKGASLVAPGLELTARGVPVAVRGMIDALKAPRIEE